MGKSEEAEQGRISLPIMPTVAGWFTSPPACPRDTEFAVAQIFAVFRRKLSVLRRIGRLPDAKCELPTWHDTCSHNICSWQEKNMLSVHMENIGEMAVIDCEGRIVRSEDAFKLRDAVNLQSDSRIIVLDLSEVSAIAGGGLGMLMFLQRWSCDHDIK